MSNRDVVPVLLAVMKAVELAMCICMVAQKEGKRREKTWLISFYPIQDDIDVCDVPEWLAAWKVVAMAVWKVVYLAAMLVMECPLEWCVVETD